MKSIATVQASMRSGTPADASRRAKPGGSDGRVAHRLAMPVRTAAVLLVALLGAGLAGCASLGLGGDRADAGARAGLANPPRLHDDAAGEDASRVAARRQIESYYAAMLRAEQAYGAIPPETSAGVVVARYVAEGIGLVDSYCLRWFQHLEDFERHANARKKDYNVVSALGTALIGIAKLHSNVTAVYGAANTAYTGWGDNQQQALVIAPSSRGVKNKVMAVMQERAAQVRARAGSIEFPEARHALESYADLCTYTSAKDLVDVSVAAATPEVSPAGQFTIVSTARFAPDESSAALRKLWKPDGRTTDTAVAAKLREWLTQEKVPASITSFLDGDTFAPLRRRALREIDFDRP